MCDESEMGPIRHLPPVCCSTSALRVHVAASYINDAMFAVGRISARGCTVGERATVKEEKVLLTLLSPRPSVLNSTDCPTFSR